MQTVAGIRQFCGLLTAVAIVTLPAAGNAADPAMLGLQKRGEGSLRFLGVPLYRAALWTEGSVGAPDPSAESVLLRINYERNIKRERIMKITRKEWQRLRVAEPEQQSLWLQELETLLPDIKRGDELSSLVLPNQETRFYFAGRELGRIDDPAFGAAFLAIWLDPRTRAAKLRDQLLTQREIAEQQIARR